MSLSEVYRAAVALEAEFDTDAHDIALERADRCLARGDHDGHHHWSQVSWALQELAKHPEKRN